MHAGGIDSLLYRECIRDLCETRGITFAEAVGNFNALSPRLRERARGHAERRMSEKRREAAGHPTYQPRNDFTVSRHA